MISNEWKEVNLSEVCEIIGGGTPKTSISNYWNGDIPWLSVVDFNSDNRHVFTTEKTITESGLNNSSTKILNKGDIIISARGTVGALAQLAMPMAFNQSCYGIRANNKSINDFLYYSFKNILKDIKANTHGSVFDTITRNTFEILNILLPSLPEQKAIAATLSCLDDMIELNNRTNKILEEMAQAIFKRWFVDFEFPNEDGEPYKSSGGEMVASELGEIPKGWRVRELSELAEIINGYSYKGSELKESKDALMTIKNFDRAGGFKIDGFKEFEISERVKERHYVEAFDVLIACTDLTQKAEIIGNPVLVLTKSKYNNLVASMDLIKIVPKLKKISNYFLYMLLKNESFKEFAIGYTSGTTVLHLDKKCLLQYRVVLPSDIQMLMDLDGIMEPIFKLISENINESGCLINIRDNLLPKLMSGEIRVPVEEVV